MTQALADCFGHPRGDIHRLSVSSDAKSTSEIWIKRNTELLYCHTKPPDRHTSVFLPSYYRMKTAHFRPHTTQAGPRLRRPLAQSIHSLPISETNETLQPTSLSSGNRGHLAARNSIGQREVMVLPVEPSMTASDRSRVGSRS